MMKNIISLPYLKDTLKRSKVIILAALILAALSVISNLSSLYILLSQYEQSKGLMSPTYVTLADINSFAARIAQIIAPLMTVMSFSYLTKRNEADFYEALPVSRRARAVTGMIATAGASMAIILASSLVALVGIIPCLGKVATLGVGISLLQLLGYLLTVLLAVSVATLAVSLTGTVRFAICTTVLILGAPRTILAVTNNAIGNLEPTLMSGHIIPLFDNNYNILTASVAGNVSVFMSPAAFIYTLVLTAIYAVLAVYAFEHRPGEAATHAFIDRRVRYGFIILLTAVISALGMLVATLDTFFTALGVVIVAVSAGVYFLLAFIYGKGERHIVPTLKGFGIFAGVNVAMLVIILSASAMLGAYSPSADKIKHVSLAGGVDDTTDFLSYDEYVALRAEDIRLDGEETKIAVAAALDRGSDKLREDGQKYTAVSMKIRSGITTAYRTLYFTDKEYQAILAELSLDEGYESLWLEVTDGAESPMVSACYEYVMADELLAAMERDVKKMGLDAWLNEVISYEDYVADVQFSYLYRGRSISVSVPLTENMPEAFECYKALYRDAAEKQVADMKEILLDAIAGKRNPLTLQVGYIDGESKDYRYIEVEISPENPKASSTVNSLLGLVGVEYTSMTELSVYIYDDDLFGDYYYFDFGIADGVSLDQLLGFFKNQSSSLDGKL